MNNITIYDKSSGERVDLTYSQIRDYVYINMLSELAEMEDTSKNEAFIAGCLVGCAKEHLTILFEKPFQRSDYDLKVLETFMQGITSILHKEVTEEDVKEIIEDLTDEFLSNDNYVILSAV